MASKRRLTVHERDRTSVFLRRCAASDRTTRRALSIIASGADRYPRARLRELAEDAISRSAEFREGKHDNEIL